MGNEQFDRLVAPSRLAENGPNGWADRRMHGIWSVKVMAETGFEGRRKCRETATR
jgi:hypothetical protein